MADIAVFKIEKGRAKAYDAKGNYVKSIGDSDAVDARIQGEAITITYANGKLKMYDMKGNFKKTL